MTDASKGKFDPYRAWFGIPPKDQPPHYYRLLGLALYEDDPDVIENATDCRMAHLRCFSTGTHSRQSQEILNELSVAKRCLLGPKAKVQYDEQLRLQLASASADRKSTMASTQQNSRSTTQPATIAPGDPRSDRNKVSQDQIFQLALDAMCCMMVADRHVARAELVKIRKLMEQLKCSWPTGELQRRVNEFVSLVKRSGVDEVVERVCLDLGAVISERQCKTILKCIDLIAMADGHLDDRERVIRRRIKEALETAVTSSESGGTLGHRRRPACEATSSTSSDRKEAISWRIVSGPPAASWVAQKEEHEIESNVKQAFPVMVEFLNAAPDRIKVIAGNVQCPSCATKHPFRKKSNRRTFRKIRPYLGQNAAIVRPVCLSGSIHFSIAGKAMANRNCES